MKTDRGFFRNLGRRLMEVLGQAASEYEKDSQAIERSIGMQRMWEQLWNALDNYSKEPNEWAWPVDIYLGDSNEVFAILTQGGKLYQVALDYSGETVQLGDWVQVREEFTPISQSHTMRITRQKDGRYRWLFIASTTVLNRVAEIDAASLFDSFVAHAEQTGEYPRLDFYHMGGVDPDLWEFGTADYLARDGVCYIASGLFDEDHPLAQATIRAFERGDGDKWGCSPEFYALGEAELLVLEPEVRIPVYKEGINVRISLVLEKEAAGWFTGSGTIKEVSRSMDEKVLERLKELYGEDEEGLQNFAERVDGTNEQVARDRLVHRSKRAIQSQESEEEESEESEEEESEEIDVSSQLESIELDEEIVQAVAAAVLQHADFRALVQPLLEAAQAAQEAAKSIQGMEQITQQVFEISQNLVDRVEDLEGEMGQEQEERSQDIPAFRKLKVSYRPRHAYSAQVEDLEEDLDLGLEDQLDLGLVDSEELAGRTLSNLPKY